MRLLITGNRHLDDYALVTRALTVAIEELTYSNPDDKEIIVVHGGATGADSLAERYVTQVRKFLAGKGITIRSEVHPADWSIGKFAGPKRNQEMVDAGADICVAFFKTGEPNKGTTHCSSAARKAGIKVLEFNS